MVVHRFEVRLDPAHGAEIQKTRPCAVVPPDELNQSMRTAIVAPMTTRGFPSPFRIACRFKGKKGLSRVLVALPSSAGVASGLLADSVIMTYNLATVLDKAIHSVFGKIPDMTDVAVALRHTLGL